MDGLVAGWTPFSRVVGESPCVLRRMDRKQVLSPNNSRHYNTFTKDIQKTYINHVWFHLYDYFIHDLNLNNNITLL